MEARASMEPGRARARPARGVVSSLGTHRDVDGVVAGGGASPLGLLHRHLHSVAVAAPATAAPAVAAAGSPGGFTRGFRRGSQQDARREGAEHEEGARHCEGEGCARVLRSVSRGRAAKPFRDEGASVISKHSDSPSHRSTPVSDPDVGERRFVSRDSGSWAVGTPQRRLRDPESNDPQCEDFHWLLNQKETLRLRLRRKGRSRQSHPHTRRAAPRTVRLPARANPPADQPWSNAVAGPRPPSRPRRTAGALSNARS